MVAVVERLAAGIEDTNADPETIAFIIPTGPLKHLCSVLIGQHSPTDLLVRPCDWPVWWPYTDHTIVFIGYCWGDVASIRND